jgi:hypothetical protein
VQTHIHKMEITGNEPRQNVPVTWLIVKSLHRQETSLIQSSNLTNLDIQNTTLGYGFNFQHRNPGALPIESFMHDSGHTLVHAKYCYQKGSPNTNS